MELNDIQKLMQTFNDTGLNRLQYTDGTASLVLEKGIPFSQAPAAHPAPMVQSAQTPVAHETHPIPHHVVEVRPAAVPEPEMNRVVVENIIKAPMVGVFYPAPSPDASPYVQIGQSVLKGQTLCILEAMKVLNEIQAEWDGIVEAILVESETIVEYGQPLFQVRRA